MIDIQEGTSICCPPQWHNNRPSRPCNAGGRRSESHCAISLPTKWLLTYHDYPLTFDSVKLRHSWSSIAGRGQGAMTMFCNLCRGPWIYSIRHALSHPEWDVPSKLLNACRLYNPLVSYWKTDFHKIVPGPDFAGGGLGPSSLGVTKWETVKV